MGKEEKRKKGREIMLMGKRNKENGEVKKRGIREEGDKQKKLMAEEVQAKE